MFQISNMVHQDTLDMIHKVNIAAFTTHVLSLENTSILCLHRECAGADVCHHYLTRAQFTAFQKAFEEQIASYFETSRKAHPAWGLFILHRTRSHVTLEAAAAQANINYETILMKMPPFILFGIERTRATVTFEAGYEPIIISDLRRPILWQATERFNKCENRRITSVSECFEAEIMTTKDPELTRFYLSFQNCSADYKFFEYLARSLHEVVPVPRRDIDECGPRAQPDDPPVPTSEEMRRLQDVVDGL